MQYRLLHVNLKTSFRVGCCGYCVAPRENTQMFRRHVLNLHVFEAYLYEISQAWIAVMQLSNYLSALKYFTMENTAEFIGAAGHNVPES